LSNDLNIVLIYRTMEAQRKASNKYYERNRDVIRLKRRMRYQEKKDRTFTCQECALKYENHEEKFMCFLCEEAETNKIS